MPVKTITDLHVEQGMPVLVRVDFNVPLRADGSVLDDRRIRMAVPTIKCILDVGGIAVCMSHLGRPAGTGPEEKYSLSPVADVLQLVARCGAQGAFCCRCVSRSHGASSHRFGESRRCCLA